MPDLSRCCCCSCCCSVWWWWWWVGTKGHDDSPLQTPPMVKIRPAHQTVALAHHLFFPFLVYFKIFFLTWFHSDFYDNFSVFDFVVFFFSDATKLPVFIILFSRTCSKPPREVESSFSSIRWKFIFFFWGWKRGHCFLDGRPLGIKKFFFSFWPCRNIIRVSSPPLALHPATTAVANEKCFFLFIIPGQKKNAI